MRNAGWIAVVESGEAWAAALRVALRRSASTAASATLPNVTRAKALNPQELDLAAPIFYAVEVRKENVPESLDLFDQLRAAPLTAAAALLPRVATRSPSDSHELELALLEAGACLAISSPRQMPRVAQAAVRWLRLADDDRRARQSLSQHAIDGLPWQAAPTGLR